jgi:dipeptidyl aminopeptidase/acylaminoacyl peptidase
MEWFSILGYISLNGREAALRLGALSTKYQAGKKFAVVIYNHAGNNGATIDTIKVLETQLLPSQCLAEHTFLLMPSFRGESLQAADLGTYHSEGQKSILDGDVDDALAMLNGVLQNIPEADEENIKAWGVSRGGGVSMLMSVRDRRIKTVVDASAETDLLLPSIQEQIQRSVDYNTQPINPVHLKVMEIVQAYLLGEISLASAHKELIQSSVVYFADQLPSLQIHHGAKDIIIPVEHSQRLYQALQALERSENITQELYIYPQGDHNILSLVGSGERIERFLCQ